MKPVPTNPNTGENFSFRAIPLQPWADVLAQLGLAALAYHLENGSKPAMDKLFSRQFLQTLERGSINQNKRPLYHFIINLREKWGLGADTVTLPNRHSKKRVFKSWLYRSQWQIARAVGGSADRGLPAAFWPVAARIAWDNPKFRFEAATLVQQYLRTRVLWIDSQPPSPRFSPQVIWGLILLTPPGWPPLYQRGSRPMRRRRRLYRQLRTMAKDAFQDHGWAQFWDIWLLGQVKWQNRQPLMGWPTWLKMSLQNLPGVSQPSSKANHSFTARILRALARIYAAFFGKTASPAPITAKKWRGQIPDPLKPFFTNQLGKSGGTRSCSTQKSSPR